MFLNEKEIKEFLEETRYRPFPYVRLITSQINIDSYNNEKTLIIGVRPYSHIFGDNSNCIWIR